MQITETSAEGLTRQYKVVIPAGELAALVDTKLAGLVQQVRMPGFRPGKAPVALIKKQYGRAVLGEVLQEQVGEASRRVVTDNNLRPALEPKIDAEPFEDGKDLVVTFDYELLPDVAPGDLKSIALEKEVAEIADDEVTQAVERIAGEQRKFETITEARAAEKGDVLVFDFLGKVDGVAFEGGAAEDYELELGSGRFIPGFEDQLVGTKAGEEKLVEVTFPADYGNTELAGKPATFECKIKEIKAAQAVAIDDELAKQLGLDNLDALKDAVKKQLAEQYDQFSRAKLKRVLFDKLNEMHGFPLPPTMVQMEFDQIWNELAQDPAQLENEKKESGKDEDGLKADYRAIAERRVRLGLLLSEIGRLNNVEVKPEEVTRAMIDQARRFPGQERKVMEFYQKNPEAAARLRAPIYEDKVVDFILGLVAMTEKTVPLAELMKVEEAA
ncbi:MAG: trigger factor [Ferrovibrionaceae bacterium]